MVWCSNREFPRVKICTWVIKIIVLLEVCDLSLVQGSIQSHIQDYIDLWPQAPLQSVCSQQAAAECPLLHCPVVSVCLKTLPSLPSSSSLLKRYTFWHVQTPSWHGLVQFKVPPATSAVITNGKSWGIADAVIISCSSRWNRAESCSDSW